jgi:hypothetical protein
VNRHQGVGVIGRWDGVVAPLARRVGPC